jgi:hypothetical protein
VPLALISPKFWVVDSRVERLVPNAGVRHRQHRQSVLPTDGHCAQLERVLEMILRRPRVRTLDSPVDQVEVFRCAKLNKNTPRSTGEFDIDRGPHSVPIVGQGGVGAWQPVRQEQ